MLKSRIMKMSELKKSTWMSALAVGASFILLFMCTFRVSNTTTLVILSAAAFLAVFSIVSTSKLRYALIVALTAGVALQMIIRKEGSGIYQISVGIRFVITALPIAYFGTLLSQFSQKNYLDLQRLASEREDALRNANRMLLRLNALVVVITAIGKKGMKANLREMFAECLQEARKVFNADSGLIYSVSRKTGKLHIVSSFGYGDKLLEKMEKKGTGNVDSCPACTGMEAVAVDNLATDEKCPNLATVHSGSSICLPIRTRNNLWGVLHLRRQHPDAFTEEDIDLAKAITYQFTLAMQRAYLLEQLNLLAITDSLTGLFNYRKLTRDLQVEIVRSRRYRHPFSLIMVDIDHFKECNDIYGHQVGDEVLRQVAKALDSDRREVDRVYRYGGEEFSVLLPETDWREAVAVAEKLRRRIESLEVKIEGRHEPLKTAVSMGVASFPNDSDDLDGLAARSDEALYVAKNSGRNRVVAYADIEEEEKRRAHPERIDSGAET